MVFSSSFFSVIYKGDFGTSGSVYSIVTGCKSFIDQYGNTIVPQFKFESNCDNSPKISCHDMSLDYSLKKVITSHCSNIYLGFSGKIDFIISNIGEIDIIGVNCDSGLS